MSEAPQRLSREELAAEGCTSLPAKEVISLLDLNVDLDLALDLAAPIDLAVAANANVAAPIDAAASANLLSLGSSSTAVANQGVMIDQYLSGEAIAEAPQTAIVDQSGAGLDAGGDDALVAAAPATDEAPATTLDSGTVTGTAEAVGGAVTETGETVAGAGEAVADGGAVDTGGAVGTVTDAVDSGAVEGTVDGVTGTVGDTVDGVVEDGTNVVDDTASSVTEGSMLDGNLLNVDVNVALDADLAAPVAGAVAANANVAAPIDAAVAANIGTVDSDAIAVADQTAIISQRLEDVTAEATAEQNAEVTQ